MTGLDEMDVALTLHTHAKLTAIDLARVKALQSRAFVSSWQHAKYDQTKQPICQHCLQPGAQQHWLKCPRFAAQRSDCGAILPWTDQVPQCVALHLLVPRSPHVVSLKEYFLGLPDLSAVNPGTESEIMFLLMDPF